MPAAAISLYLFLINLTGLFSMWSDKRRAKKGRWRIRERTLFLIAVIGGSVGTIAGMYLFRHKTKHRSFRFGMPAILVLQLILAACVWIIWRQYL